MVVGIRTKESEYRGECQKQEVILSGNKTITFGCQNYTARSYDYLIIRCDICGKEFTYKRRNYFRNHSFEKDLCESCKTKKTSLLRYGKESPNQIGLIKAKQKKNNKEYADGGFWNIRKTSSKEELSRIMSEKLKKQNADPEFRKAYLEGMKLARQDPAKYLLSKESRKNITEGSRKYQHEKWLDPEYREKMAKVRFRVSRFQLALYQEKLQQDSNWKLEYPIPDTRYTADLYNPITNEIIECYGDYWHCNPKRFAPDFYHKVAHKTAQEIWDFDAQRLQELKSLGYEVIVIWESDRPNPRRKVLTN